LSDGQLRGKFAIPGFSFRPNIAFSPDGKTIAIPALDGLYLWETATGKPIRSFQNYPRGIQRSSFTADGRGIVTSSMYDTVLRVVYLDGRAAPSAQHPWPGNAVPAHMARNGYLGSVTGFVKDTADRPIVDAEIAIFDGDRPGSPPLFHASTNAAGRFLVQLVRSRHLSVRASKPGYLAEIRYRHMPSEGPSTDFSLKPERR
jgi:WD40 repeat protein